MKTLFKQQMYFVFPTSMCLSYIQIYDEGNIQFECDVLIHLLLGFSKVMKVL